VNQGDGDFVALKMQQNLRPPDSLLFALKIEEIKYITAKNSFSGNLTGLGETDNSSQLIYWGKNHA
jgi:hypothetical protein